MQIYIYLRVRDTLRFKKYIRDRILTESYIDIASNAR